MAENGGFLLNGVVLEDSTNKHMRAVGPVQPEDAHWLRRAMQLADRAADEGEVPVGALVVRDGKLIGEGWNQPIARADPSAHAEMLAIRAAAQALDNYRLAGCTLYVTLEPCVMCAGAILHARVDRVVFGAFDPRAGAVCSCYDLIARPQLNHQPDWTGGLMGSECSSQLMRFFEQRREMAVQRESDRKGIDGSS